MRHQGMEWARELGDELFDCLDGDSALIADAVGLEGLIMIWQKLTQVSLYISTKPQMEAKKRFIKAKHNGSNTKELALSLGVSERFVQLAVKEDKYQTPSLFDGIDDEPITGGAHEK